MSKIKGLRIGALVLLAVGIVIGYIASTGGFSSVSVSQASEQAATARTERAAKAIAQSEKAGDEIPDEWMPWKDPENPNVLVLEPGSRDGWKKRRDTSKDPKREAGLVNPQRY